MYNAAKIISGYMCPLCKNIYTITYTKYLANLLTLQDNEEYVSYNDELFTNMLVLETTDTLLNKFYVHIKIKPVGSKLIVKRLLLKLATDCKFTFSSNFYRQIDDCAVRRPLSLYLLLLVIYIYIYRQTHTYHIHTYKVTIFRANSFVLAHSSAKIFTLNN